MRSVSPPDGTTGAPDQKGQSKEERAKGQDGLYNVQPSHPAALTTIYLLEEFLSCSAIYKVDGHGINSESAESSAMRQSRSACAARTAAGSVTAMSLQAKKGSGPKLQQAALYAPSRHGGGGGEDKVCNSL
jgi:hypothetical protein